jgi:UDP-2,4-diacetamido-2,4,6-trideoxy-beta-L-altropyranose hydrolase
MKILMRADASPSAGTGHAMRCLALSQALVDRGHQVVLATAEIAEPLARRFAAESVEIARLDIGLSAPDLDQTRALAARMGSEAVVIDGYQFDAEYVAGMGLAARVLTIDDRGMPGVQAAMVLNQNQYASAAAYPGRAPEAELLLGPRYALLRREFSAAPPDRVVAGNVERVLLTLGGADPQDATRRLLAALRDVPQLRVIVGPLHPDRQRLADEVSAAGGTAISDVADMPAQLAWADLVVGAAGTSALEFAWAGLPAVLVVAADNQEPVARSMEEAGTAINLGRPDADAARRLAKVVSSLSHDAARRDQLGAAGRHLVDGRGASRVAARIEANMTLRQATELDGRLLFEWANDPAVRAASFSTAPIAWDEHLTWLRARLVDPQSRLYIAELAGRPVGAARFALHIPRAVISVSLAADARGEGLGERLIALASHRLMAESQVRGVDAWVRPNNAASMRAFAAAGYVQRSVAAVPDGVAPEAMLLTYESAGRG